MEKNIQSPVLSIVRSFSSETNLLPDSIGVVVLGLSLGALIRRIGLWKALRSKIARARYTLRLWLIREIYLWKALNDKFEQIPDSTKEKRLLALVRKYPFLSRLIERFEKRLNKKLIADPYQPSLTINKSKVKKRKTQQLADQINN